MTRVARSMYPAARMSIVRTRDGIEPARMPRVIRRDTLDALFGPVRNARSGCLAEPDRRAPASHQGQSIASRGGDCRDFPLIGESTTERERAKWLAPSLLCWSMVDPVGIRPPRPGLEVSSRR